MRRPVAITAALALVLTACAGGDETTPEVDASAPDLPEASDDDAGDADADGPGDTDPAGDADDDADATSEDPDPDGDGGDSGSSPTADEQALADPCADHLDREGEAFLELVAPVDDQLASGELELVGCSSVPEGTVQYRLLDGDGATLDEGFTTAECGGPCIGAFRVTVSLEAAAGEPVVYLQVYWEDLSDGGERGLEERVVVLG